MPVSFVLNKKGGAGSNKSSSKSSSKSKPKPTSKPTPRPPAQRETNSELSGFIEVSKAEWGSIPLGTLIKYYRIDGTFIPGGYVTKIWYNDEDKVNYISLEHEKKVGSNNAHSISFNRISKLFKHPSLIKPPETFNESVPQSISSQSVSSQSMVPSGIQSIATDDKMQMMLNYIRKQEFKYNTLETTVGELVNRIKQLESKLSVIQSNACMLSDVVSNINSTLCKK